MGLRIGIRALKATVRFLAPFRAFLRLHASAGPRLRAGVLRCSFRSEMPQDVGSLELGEVVRDILFDLSPHLWVELFHQLMVNIPARRQETPINVIAAGHDIDSLRELP